MGQGGIQFQSSLGNIHSTQTETDRVWKYGNLAVGLVLKLHPKRYTADVRLYATGDVLASGHSQEGRYSCRICVDNAGYDNVFKKPYGKVVPIQKGSLVLVGFLNNSKSKPVILSVLHNIAENNAQNNQKNILDSIYSSDGKGEISRYLNITPIQDFISLNRDGNLEVASHNKSFVVASSREIDPDNFDFEDLSVKQPDNHTITSGERYFSPLNFLASFRSKFVDSATDWLKVYVNAARTSFKLAKLQQAENKATVLEITDEGAFRVRRQLDTRDTNNSDKYTELSITADGKIEMVVAYEGGSEGASFMSVDPDGGLGVSSETEVRISGTQTVFIKGGEVNVVSDFVNVEAKETKISKSDLVEIKSKEVKVLECEKAEIRADEVKIAEAENTSIESSTLTAKCDDIKFTGYMTLNNKCVAVQGDGTSDGAVIV